MYLKNGLNLKGFFIFFCILLSLILFADLYLSRSIALIFIGILICYLVRIVCQIFTEGFFILLDKRNIDGNIYHVRDFIYPRSLKKSFREISQPESQGFISRSPLLSGGSKEVFFLQIMRDLTASLFLQQILLLGGAGCSLASYFVENKIGKKVDVIEYNPTMIEWAKKYFLKNSRGINLMQGDGLKFSKLVDGPYDLIIIDMFDAYELNKGVVDRAFIKDIQSALNKNGKFILNLGFALQFESIVKKWQEFFTLHIYISGANLLISNIKLDSFAPNSRSRFLLTIPRLSAKSK